MLHLILALLFGAPATVALAAGAPKFDIQSTCRAAEPANGETAASKRETYEKCMRGELSARKELGPLLTRASAADRRICLQEAGGLYPSYIELLVCLELRETPMQETRAPNR